MDHFEVNVQWPEWSNLMVPGTRSCEVKGAVAISLGKKLFVDIIVNAPSHNKLPLGFFVVDGPTMRSLDFDIREGFKKMKATIFIVDNLLVAKLADGQEFVEEDPLVTADLLWAHAVRAAEITMLDWHSDPCAAPLTGHKVAIYGRLRELEMGNG